MPCIIRCACRCAPHSAGDWNMRPLMLGYLLMQAKRLAVQPGATTQARLMQEAAGCEDSRTLGLRISVLVCLSAGALGYGSHDSTDHEAMRLLNLLVGACFEFDSESSSVSLRDRFDFARFVHLRSTN